MTGISLGHIWLTQPCGWAVASLVEQGTSKAHRGSTRERFPGGAAPPTNEAWFADTRRGLERETAAKASTRGSASGVAYGPSR